MALLFLLIKLEGQPEKKTEHEQFSISVLFLLYKLFQPLLLTFESGPLIGTVFRFFKNRRIQVLKVHSNNQLLSSNNGVTPYNVAKRSQQYFVKCHK